jgi:hypothetical protein
MPNYAGMYTKDCTFYDIAYLVDLFNLILYLFHEDYIQPELLVALLDVGGAYICMFYL